MSNNNRVQLFALVNRSEPFEFTFDGITLEGQWYKWRTTSPNYQRQRAEKLAGLPEIPEEGDEETKQKALEAWEQALRKVNAQTLKDTIKSWNAVEVLQRTLTKDEYAECSPRVQRLYKLTADDNEDLGYTIINEADADVERPVPVDIEVFEELPQSFVTAMAQHFQKIREETLNPPKPDSSQNG